MDAAKVVGADRREERQEAGEALHGVQRLAAEGGTHRHVHAAHMLVRHDQAVQHDREDAGGGERWGFGKEEVTPYARRS